jgi:hypothetical protein
MDDFQDGFAAGWEQAMAEAERRCTQVWLPAGGYIQAATVAELVRIRRMPELAKKGRQS